MNEPKPCPFCGGEARIEVTSDFYGSGGNTAIVMFVNHDDGCIASSMDIIVYGYVHFDPFAHPDAIEKLVRDFAELWNRRA